jgi:HlyD family secretion protein
VLLVWRPRRLGFALVAILLTFETRLGFQNTSKVQVTMAPVTAGAITHRIVATGTLQAMTTVDVGSDVAGIVRSVDADCNAFVHAGQIVARIDSSSFDAEMREAESALIHEQVAERGLEADVRDAQARLARAEALSAKQILSQSDLDACRLALDQATARLVAGQFAAVQAQAVVDRASVDLSRTIIRSPVDGIVVERNGVAGRVLAASPESPALFRIATDLNQMQVRVNIDRVDVDAVIPHEPATFEVASYAGETFRGTVAEVLLQTVMQHFATAIVDVANPDERLRPGMVAEVTLNGAQRETVIRIPNAALSFHPAPDVLAALGEIDWSPVLCDPLMTSPTGGEGKSCEVWRYDGERLTPIAVRAGLSDDGWTELLGGPIHPGDPLVTGAQLPPASPKR